MLIPFITHFFLVWFLCTTFNNFTHFAVRVMNIHSGASTFVVTVGAILRCCAVLLWTVQGSLMMAYPTKAPKGMYISTF